MAANDKYSVALQLVNIQIQRDGLNNNLFTIKRGREKMATGVKSSNHDMTELFHCDGFFAELSNVSTSDAGLFVAKILPVKVNKSQIKILTVEISNEKLDGQVIESLDKAHFQRKLDLGCLPLVVVVHGKLW